ncbi:MAG: pyruvate dehydrogenase (acetyl-transferring) E1 component subunit alpha [Hyphomicrobiales bacterium]|nr:pyruvate dehydrogenase (acetyl-transferring) E1 component subunit alpha [Hyphomicrobiales bacterium]MCP5373418.1 pyruvate dehydrogenase (acetyl-transferring) E1 component subunit alpha [Hyphomicrobiales bacterium]
MTDRVADFHVDFTRFLAPDGTAVAPLPGFFDDPTLRRLYGHMVLARAFDTKAIALQRTGRLGTYAPSLGQEAVAVAVGAAMVDTDVLVPSFREHGAQLVRGVTLQELFLFWAGDERGNDFAGPRQDFPVCIPVGSHAPHAAGVALAFKLRREARAAVCVFGDGATSKGDVYEAMNLAGAWTLPLVFVVANNQWAISVRRAHQTAARTLAQKAVAAGFAGEQVDGNDVVALCHALRQALDRARAGGGPHLIEALTYRLGDHTTADDASRYRDDEEVGRHWKEDPIARLRAHLTARGAWTRDDEEALLTDCAARVEAAARDAQALAPEPAAALFDHLYATLPPALAGQRAALVQAEADHA